MVTFKEEKKRKKNSSNEKQAAPGDVWKLRVQKQSGHSEEHGRAHRRVAN